MKTDDLIALMAANADPVAPGVARRRLLIGSLVGALGACVLVFTLLPPRGLAHAAQTGPFWMKLGYCVWLAIGGWLLADRAARPGAPTRTATWVLGAGIAAIASLAVIDLAFTPLSGWHAAWMGSSALFCPFAILITAVPVFVAVAVAIRGLAPTRLRVAGAAAGLLAGAVGAAVYGLWCRETAAVFVASWYTLGIAACAGLGALLGPRALRW